MKHSNVPGQILGAILLATSTTLVVPAPDAVIDKNTRYTVRIKYSDLDMSRKEGVQALQGRIKMAATKVCGGRSYRAAGMQRQHKACVNRTMHDAMQRIDSQQRIGQIS